MRVLLVTGMPVEGAYLHKALRECAHSVRAIDELRDGLYLASEEAFAAIVIVSGDKAFVDALQALLPSFAALPDAPTIIVVLSNATAPERARLLRAGADACFVQPYSFTEMQERMIALQRRRALRRDTIVEPSGLMLDASTHELIEGARRMAVTKGEYLLMECLLRAPDRPISREQLIHYAWPDKEEVEPASVSLVVSRLRRKLIAQGFDARIETVSRFGYQLCTNPAENR